MEIIIGLIVAFLGFFGGIHIRNKKRRKEDKQYVKRSTQVDMSLEKTKEKRKQAETDLSKPVALHSLEELNDSFNNDSGSDSDFDHGT